MVCPLDVLLGRWLPETFTLTGAGAGVVGISGFAGAGAMLPLGPPKLFGRPGTIEFPGLIPGRRGPGPH